MSFSVAIKPVFKSFANFTVRFCAVQSSSSSPSSFTHGGRCFKSSLPSSLLPPPPAFVFFSSYVSPAVKFVLNSLLMVAKTEGFNNASSCLYRMCPWSFKRNNSRVFSSTLLDHAPRTACRPAELARVHTLKSFRTPLSPVLNNFPNAMDEFRMPMATWSAFHQLAWRGRDVGRLFLSR